MKSSIDWEAVWEDLDNDANGEWSPKTYRALTTQKSIQGFRKGGIGILPLSPSIDFCIFKGYVSGDNSDVCVLELHGGGVGDGAGLPMAL